MTAPQSLTQSGVDLMAQQPISVNVHELQEGAEPSDSIVTGLLLMLTCNPQETRLVIDPVGDL